MDDLQVTRPKRTACCRGDLSRFLAARGCEQSANGIADRMPIRPFVSLGCGRTLTVQDATSLSRPRRIALQSFSDCQRRADIIVVSSAEWKGTTRKRRL